MLCESQPPVTKPCKYPNTIHEKHVAAAAGVYLRSCRIISDQICLDIALSHALSGCRPSLCFYRHDIATGGSGGRKSSDLLRHSRSYALRVKKSCVQKFTAFELSILMYVQRTKRKAMYIRTPISTCGLLCH